MKLICLDRDGIINKLVINHLTKEIDSPQTIEEIKISSWIPYCIKELNNYGYTISICTNQPSAAKNNNTIEKLQEIHNHIVDKVQSYGGKIFSSHICLHKAENGCECRKPKTGMVEEAFALNNYDKSKSWFVGDKWSDIAAGNSFGLKTALLTQLDMKKQMAILEEKRIMPTFVGADLRDFADYLQSQNHYLT